MKGSNIGTYLLCETDLSSSEQQHAALQLNVLLLQNVQILLTAVVAVHQLTLQTKNTSQS